MSKVAFFTFFIFFSLLSPNIAIAQNRIHIDKSCSFNGTLPEEDLYGFDSDQDAETALRRIMKHTGLPAKFKIQAANVPNAAAVIYGEERFILYNQEFMRGVKNVTMTDWASVSILAHEIGHHLSGHTLDKIGSRPDKELEADKFSGFILRKMGATLEQAKAAMSKIASDQGSHTHPPKSARLAAIANGWYSADEIMGKDDKSDDEDITPTRPTPKVDFPPVDNSPVIKTPTGVFNNVWTEFDQVRDGQKGILIHVNFNINYLRGQNCTMNVWFNYQNGNKLMDFDGKFRSVDGQVAVTENFTPGFDNTTYSDMQIFMPYDELHMVAGKHDLKFNMGIFKGNQRIGVESQFFNFWYSK